MDAVLGAFVALPALALGSFLNVVAARLPERRSVVQSALGLRGLRGARSPGTTTSRVVSYLVAARPLPDLRARGSG